MKFQSKTTSNDKPLQDFLKRLEQLTGRHVEYGYDDKDIHEPSGLGMATLASIHEYGYGVPERDFMWQTFKNMETTYTNQHCKQAQSYLFGGGGSITSLFTQMGKQGVEMIKYTIDTGSFEELSPVTIERKKAKGVENPSKPLEEYGALRDGAEYKVVLGGLDGGEKR